MTDQPTTATTHDRVIEMGTDHGRGTVVEITSKLGADYAAVRWDDRASLVDWVPVSALTVVRRAV